MERFGKHLRECQWERIEIDFPGHPLDGFVGWLVAVGSVITRNPSGRSIGDTDRLLLLDNYEDPILLNQARIKPIDKR